MIASDDSLSFSPSVFDNLVSASNQKKYCILQKIQFQLIYAHRLGPPPPSTLAWADWDKRRAVTSISGMMREHRQQFPANCKARPWRSVRTHRHAGQDSIQCGVQRAETSLQHSRHNSFQVITMETGRVHAFLLMETMAVKSRSGITMVTFINMGL